MSKQPKRSAPHLIGAKRPARELTRASHFYTSPDKFRVLLHLAQRPDEWASFFDMRDVVKGDLRGVIRSLVCADFLKAKLVRRGFYYSLSLRGQLLVDAIDPDTLELKPGREVPRKPNVCDECRYNWKYLEVFQIMGSGARAEVLKRKDNVKAITQNRANREFPERSEAISHSAA